MAVRLTSPWRLGQSEIGEPEVAARVDHQVPRLDVAVEHALLVRVVERLGRLDAEAGHRAEERPVVRQPRRGRTCVLLAGLRGRDGGNRRDRAILEGVARRRGRVSEPVSHETGKLPDVKSRGEGPGCSRVGGRPLAPRVFEPAEIPDDGGERPALDELHGVVMHALLTAHRVDRHDVRVVEQRRGVRLELEPLPLPRIECGRVRQDLERDPTAQRDLLGLVHDPHAAASKLAKQPKVAQDAHRLCGHGCPLELIILSVSCGQLFHGRWGKRLSWP